MQQWSPQILGDTLCDEFSGLTTELNKIKIFLLPIHKIEKQTSISINQ